MALEEKRRIRLDKTSPEQFREDSKTIRYEFVNLVGNALEYNDEWHRTEPIRNNAYVEAFALHFRSLFQFFYADYGQMDAEGISERFLPPREDDVIALDYISSWKDDCPPPNAELVKAKKPADKFIAHITTKRRGVNQTEAGEKSNWNMKAIAGSICEVMEKFISKVSPEKFDANEKRVIEEMIEVYRKRTV